MLLIEKTIERFGYSPLDLSKGSKKKVVCQCDYCGGEYFPVFYNRNRCLEKMPHLQKDCCKPCGPKKTRESWEILGIAEQKHLAMLEKQKTTNREKYGTDYFAQCPEGKQQAADVWANMTPERKKEIRKAQEQGMFEKYGVYHGAHSPEIYQKMVNTWIKNLGVTNPSLSSKVQEKRENTMNELYGVKNIMHHQYYKSKCFLNMQNSMIQNYGVKNPHQLDWVKEKSQQTRAENGHITLYNNKSLNQWATELNTTYDVLYPIVQAQGIDGLINFNKSDSYTSIEYLIAGVLEKYNINFIYDKYLGKNRFDFKIDSHKLIIEACGNWWHCDGWIEKRYHQQKRYNYLNNGYSSLFFWESEIIQKAAIVESIIKERLGMNELVTLDVFNIEEIETTTFFQNNSLLTSKGKHKIGLVLNGEMLAAMEFDLYDKMIIIRRAASKLGVFIPEIISQFINYLTLTYDLNKIIYYVDFRIENEDLLLMNGFEYKGEFLDYMKTDLKNIFDKKEIIEGRQHKLWNAGLGKFELTLKQS